MENIFRAYDIRGIFGKELTLEIAENLGKAFGSFVNEDEVVVGYDTRESSEKIFERFVAGILSTGKDVISVGKVPSPVAYFYGFKNNIPGCMITASHNPPEYNGFKFFRKDGTSYTSELLLLKDSIKRGEFKMGAGTLSEVDYAIEDYKNYIDERIGAILPIKIVAECFNASAGLIVPYLFEKLNINCLAINNKCLGDFGGKRPEPKKDNIGELSKKVLEENASFGVAFDGDADRAVFVDETGKIIESSKIAILIIKNILKNKKASIVATVDCPVAVGELVKESGANLIWCRIGHGFIEEKLRDEKALFAYEQSAHFYINTFYPFSDGFLTAVIISKIVSESGKKMSALIDEIKLNPTEKIYVKVKSHELKEKVIENIKKMYRDAEDCVDGIKIHFGKEEWVLIRVSQTNPEINICAEAKTSERLAEIINEYSNIVNTEIKKVI